MTNAFDLLVYLALSGIILLLTFGFSLEFIVYGLLIFAGFILFSIPFSYYFEPFSSGIGFNCVSNELTTSINKHIAGTILQNKLYFEGKCQASPTYMLITLWGLFWFNFLFFGMKLISRAITKSVSINSIFGRQKNVQKTVIFVLVLFSFSTLLILAPEFIYVKDIYGAHFRANTMF